MSSVPVRAGSFHPAGARRSPNWVINTDTHAARVDGMTRSDLLRAALHTPPAISDTKQSVPGWVLRLAYALPWLLLPSCLWRLPFAFHFTMGMQNEGELVGSYWLSIPYVFGLSIITELIALLCLGLVSRWGEVAPNWMPIIGGRPITALATAIPAVIGGLMLTALFSGVPVSSHETYTLIMGAQENVAYLNGWWRALALVGTAPLRLWGPIVIVLALAHLHRRRATGRDRLGKVIPDRLGEVRPGR